MTIDVSGKKTKKKTQSVVRTTNAHKTQVIGRKHDKLRHRADSAVLFLLTPAVYNVYHLHNTTKHALKVGTTQKGAFGIKPSLKRVKNRNLLDGPFIVSVILSTCHSLFVRPSGRTTCTHRDIDTHTQTETETEIETETETETETHVRGSASDK